MFYLLIPVYAHKVSRGDDLLTYANKIIKISVTGQFAFMLYLIWITAAVAHSKHLALQYAISNILAIVVAVFANGIVVTYLTDRYLPKIQLNMKVYDRFTRHELIWIMALMAFFYYIGIWYFYNQFNPYTM